MRCVHSYRSPSAPWLICVLQLEGDDRSDQEEEEDDSDPPSDKRQSLINGSAVRDRANGHWRPLTAEEISFELAVRI